MNSQLSQTSRGPVEYTLFGSGPAILVCHGTSSNCFSTVTTEPLAQSGFSMLTPSRPGFGRTSLGVGRTAAEAAQALIAVLDSLAIQSCSVIAISGGGPTGIAPAAGYPQRVRRIILAEAVSRPEDRPHEPSYKNQMAFYGPMHAVTWAMLGLMSRLSPHAMARQTLAILSTHDPQDALNRLSPADIKSICRFYQGHSSRSGALCDALHTVGAELLRQMHQPALVIHSREDKSVPFTHAEWSLQHVIGAQLYESGFTGHFFWIGPDFPGIYHKMVDFLAA